MKKKNVTKKGTCCKCGNTRKTLNVVATDKCQINLEQQKGIGPLQKAMDAPGCDFPRRKAE